MHTLEYITIGILEYLEYILITLRVSDHCFYSLFYYDFIASGGYVVHIKNICVISNYVLSSMFLYTRHSVQLPPPQTVTNMDHYLHFKWKLGVTGFT